MSSTPWYKFKIKDSDGEEVGILKNARDRYFSIVLNREGEAKFTLDLKDEKATNQFISLLKNELVIEREEATDVWGGQVDFYKAELNDREHCLEVSAKGYFNLLKQRYTGASRDFTATDAGEMAWTLIDESQNLADGDFGITEGTIQTSVNRDRLWEYKNIYEAIIDLSEVEDGFDFELTPAKTFNIYWPRKGSDKSDDQIFQWGKNIRAVALVKDFTEPVNSITVLGSGFSPAMLTSTQTDTTSRSNYGLRQEIYPYKDVDIQGLLDDKALRLLDERKGPKHLLSLDQIPGTDPNWGEVDVGDWVRIRITYGFLNFNSVLRIQKMEIWITDEGEERIRYHFSIL